MARASIKMLFIGKIFSAILLLVVVVLLFYNAFQVSLLEEAKSRPFSDKATLAQTLQNIRISNIACGVLAMLCVVSVVVAENARAAAEWDSQDCRIYLIILIILGFILVIFYALGGIFGLAHLNHIRNVEKS